MTETTIKVLVVEDEPGLQALLKQGLERRGYIVECCSDGEQSLLLYVSFQPDVILLDVQMPLLDGFGVCQAVRDDHADAVTPIIMLTGSDDLESIDRAFEVGATDFLPKPINLPLLMQRIRYAMRNRDNEIRLKKAMAFQSYAVHLAQVGYWGYSSVDEAFLLDEETRHLLDMTAEGSVDSDVLFGMIHEEDRPRIRKALQRMEDFTLEVRMRLPVKGYRIFTVTGTLSDTTRGLIHGAFQDVTDRQSTEDMLDYLRLHDELTGLPNQLMLTQTLPFYSASGLESNNQAALALFQVERLGTVVEAHGQKVADQFMAQLSKELKRVVQRDSVLTELFSLKDGVFAIIAEASGKKRVEQSLEAVLSRVDREWQFEQARISPLVVCGVVALTEYPTSSDVQLQFAYQALSSALKQPELRIQWYQSTDWQQSATDLVLEVDVKKKLRESGFELHFQPKVSLARNCVVGFEALIRWGDSTGTVYSPGQFLPVIERLGLMNTLGLQVIDQACAAIVGFRAAGVLCPISINLAAQQFLNEQLVDSIQDSVEQHGLKPSDIEFEITESTAMADPEQTLVTLTNLHEAGFELAIDDFGIGYSSMEYLLRFPITTLKIDRAFVSGIPDDAGIRAIVRAIATLASGLGLKTVCEGVEWPREQDYLEAIGFDVMQGFLYSRAIPASLVPAFVDEFSVAQAKR